MEWKKKKWDIDDQLWEFANETPTGFYCNLCLKEYDGSITRIKWHLAKIEGRDIDICPKVSVDVMKQVREDHFHVRIDHPRRRKLDCISTDLPSRKRVANVKTKTAGVHLLATEFLGGQFDGYVQDIWCCLMDDDHVFRIGIHGIGGVGKTEVAKYVNNKLLQNRNKFHHVFWVTMSPDWTSTSPPRRVGDLQSCISKAVGVALSDGDNETKRAAQLSQALAEKKKSVLILDDVWDYISLREVGIPIGVDQCSVVFTTRSLELCRQLGCQEIFEIRCLLPDESYDLFKKSLGEETPLVREVEEISREVASNCAGLPLAITITARNMKGVTDICQWRSALRGHIRKKADTEIFQKLKISYDYLKDPTLQHCFLCFPSLPAADRRMERFIHKSIFVEYIVDQGIIKRTSSRREEVDDAHTMVNFLGDVGLLEVTSSNVIKMNEVIQRMALQIMEENNERAMIKNDMSLKDLPDEEDWTGDLVSASLVGNQINNIPLHFSPCCPKLSTLSLSGNFGLGDIRGIFFRGMPGLKVLDLSYTNIQSLPSSTDGLVNLTALLLSSCGKLVKFPSVGKLRALKKLDLSFSAVEQVAEDIKMPGKLTYLDLLDTEVKLEPRILAQLSHLQFLRLPCGFEVKAVELARLSRLETLRCYFDDLVELDKYLVYLKGFKGREEPIRLDVRVGKLAIYQDVFADELIYVEDINAGVDKDLSAVIFHNCNINEADRLIYFQQIAIVKFREATSLCKFSPIKGATQLKHFSVRECDRLELLCSLSLPGQDILENLEYMELSNLKNLSVLFRKEANVAYGSCFSNLTRFLIEGCPSIKRLFPIQLVPNLKNLQRLYVLNCLSMEEIFASEEEETEESYLAGKKFCLSRLCIVLLEDLPELRRVCGGRLTCVIPESCSVEYKNCPKLGLDGGDICRQ